MQGHLGRWGGYRGDMPAAPGRKLPSQKSVIDLARNTSYMSPQHQKYLTLLSTLMMFSDLVSAQHTAGLMKSTECVLRCSTRLVHLPEAA